MPNKLHTHKSVKFSALRANGNTRSRPASNQTLRIGIHGELHVTHVTTHDKQRGPLSGIMPPMLGQGQAESVTSSASVEERLNQSFASLPVPHLEGQESHEHTITWLMREGSIATQSSYAPSIAMVREGIDENDHLDHHNDDGHAEERYHTHDQTDTYEQEERKQMDASSRTQNKKMEAVADVTQ